MSTSTTATDNKTSAWDYKSIDRTGFEFNHTMIRIKDPKVSVPFYEKHFGMKNLGNYKFPSLGFELFYMAIPGNAPPNTPWWNRGGILELTHNFGTENDPAYTLNNGNGPDNKGFGHICFTVDNIEDACSRLEKSGVKFQKKLTDGRMKHIAFALDPDGYWIELVANPKVETTEATDVSKYLFNHSMIRVKDPVKSLDFYQNVLGMELIHRADFEAAKFTLYFLAYNHKKGDASTSQEGVIELTHNWGTENDPDFHYHNGNDKPQGFGHWGFAVPDAEKSMEQFEKAGVPIHKRLKAGKMNFIGFILDPDGYWIEILPKADLPKIE